MSENLNQLKIAQEAMEAVGQLDGHLLEMFIKKVIADYAYTWDKLDDLDMYIAQLKGEYVKKRLKK